MKEFKTISKRATELLNRAEGVDVDYKSSAGALDPADLVAFANSPDGGTLLLGVEEITGVAGQLQSTK